MRKLIVWVFNYSIDGLMATNGTQFWDYCFSRPSTPGGWPPQIELYRSAYAHIMGRSSYEGMSVAMQAQTDHPFSPILNEGRKVVFSRTMTSADWPNTTVASGDTLEEIDKLRQGGDGHIIVWGGVGLWRSLLELDLIDEFYFSVYSFVSGVGTGIFDAFPGPYPLELVSATAHPGSGIAVLHYRRPRE